MRTVSALVAKDLRRKRANPGTTLVMLLFPVVFSVLIGMAFGGKETKLPPLEILVADEDGSFVSRFLTGAGGEEHGDLKVNYRAVERAEGEALLAKGKAAALLVIPGGFGDRFLAGEADTILVRRNPAESIMPGIADEYVKVTAMLLSTAGDVFTEPLATIKGLTSGGREPGDKDVADIAVSVRRAVAGVKDYVSPPLVKLTTASADTAAGGGAAAKRGAMAIALVVLPGISVMTLIMLGQGGMREIFRERQTGTLRRTFAAPVTTREIILAKFLSTGVMAVFGLLVLTAVGAVWGAPAPDPIAFLLLSVTFIMAICGFNSLIYGLAKTDRQGATVGEIIIMMMAFLGGSWIPLDSLPAGIRHVSPFTLNYWAVDGYNRLLFDHAAVGSLARNLLVLAALGVGGSAVGTRFLRRRLTEGAA